LANSAVGKWCPYDAVQLNFTALRTWALTFESHHAVFEAPFERERVTGVIDPRLVPHAARRVVEVDAVTTKPAGSQPVLVEGATAQNALDPIDAGDFPFLGDVPATDPEIELAVGCGCAGLRLLRRSLGGSWVRCRGAHDGDPAGCGQDGESWVHLAVSDARKCGCVSLTTWRSQSSHRCG